MKKILLGAAFSLAMTVSVFAHSPLKATMPSDGAEMTDNPDMLHLVFAKPTRVTKILLKHTVDGATHEEKLELPSKEFETELMLQPDFMGKGAYEVQWRALGMDGHALKGKFKFTVTGE